MENKGNQPAAIFDLLNQWSTNLPKNTNEFAESSISTLSQIGNEFKQRYTDLNQTSASPSPKLQHSRPSDKPQEKKKGKNTETESNAEKSTENNMIVVRTGENTNDFFKPPFAFDLRTDNEDETKTKQTFNCVYDFCLCLEQYCQSENLDIEKAWFKLLTACTTHNYDRYMWIHSTFQHADKYGIGWKQAVRRLMFKYDDPHRTMILESKMDSLRYLLSVNPGQHIYSVNQDFTRCAEELELDDCMAVGVYLEGLPENIREVIRTTMDFDDSTRFRYKLSDIQQRAAIFISADPGSYIFYSKSAHFVTSLEVEKVSTVSCEFHIIGDHTTTSCPDYTIIKYPCMDFMDSIIIKSLLETTSVSGDSIGRKQENAKSSSDDAGASRNPDITEAGESEKNKEELLVAKEEEMEDINIQEKNEKKITNVVLQETGATEDVVMSEQTAATDSPKQSAKAQFIKSLQKKDNSSTNPKNTVPAVQQNTNHNAASTSSSNNNNQSIKTKASNISANNNNQSIKNANNTMAAAAKIPAPASQAQRSVRTEPDPTNSPQPSNNESKPVSVRRVHITPSGLTAIKNINHYELKTDNIVSPTGSNHSTSSNISFIPSEPESSTKRQRSESPEKGCYLHGKWANHSTKECWQSQMVIPPRNTNNNNNQSYSSNVKKPCWYCHEEYFYGHLANCPSYHKKSRNY